VSRSLEKTVQIIGLYSKKDAETWRALVERYRAAKSKIVASLFSAPPAFSAEAAALERSSGGACHVHLTPPSLASVARASVECRGGELPATPLVVAWNDSAIDPSRAPEGKHLKKFVVLGVPYEIRGDATGHVRERDWDEAKEGYADYLIDRITADYIPDLKEKLLKRVAHSPLDLERKLSSAVHGTICHGAMLPYQTGSMRPVPEMGDYRTPVENVYLCGSGSHPGPGVSMAPGRNAAETIFSDLGLDFGATVATGATKS
jgi:beta-carotene ketolase (CrtO type)